MGQHRIQRQILRNFSFEGRQFNSFETWCLKQEGYQPESRSINSVGFFEVDCSKDVDNYITSLENGFKDTLNRLGRGEFSGRDITREMYDFIAMHYVRSQACRLQLERVLSEFQRQLGLTQPQADAEYRRLTSHQDLGVFRDLVDSVARTLTNYVLRPIVMTGAWSFVTSDKIMYAGVAELRLRETFIWFPISSSTGLVIISDEHAGQLLGPVVEVDLESGRTSFHSLPEAPVLRCYEPVPREGEESFVNFLNGLMVPGSSELYSVSRRAIDLALIDVDTPTEFRYQPRVKQ